MYRISIPHAMKWNICISYCIWYCLCHSVSCTPIAKSNNKKLFCFCSLCNGLEYQYTDHGHCFVDYFPFVSLFKPCASIDTLRSIASLHCLTECIALYVFLTAFTLWPLCLLLWPLLLDYRFCLVCSFGLTYFVYRPCLFFHLRTSTGIWICCWALLNFLHLDRTLPSCRLSQRILCLTWIQQKFPSCKQHY